MSTTATQKDFVGISSAQMNPSMMIPSELSAEKHGHVDAFIVVVVVVVVVVFFLLFIVISPNVHHSAWRDGTLRQKWRNLKNM